ncbi:hypothetical protein [Escherichia coli]
MNSSEDDLLEVAWYLSKYGKSQPPAGVTNGAIVIHTQRLKSDPGGNLLS